MYFYTITLDASVDCNTVTLDASLDCNTVILDASLECLLNATQSVVMPPHKKNMGLYWDHICGQSVG